MRNTDPNPPQQPQARPCRKCDTAWGTLGILIGLGIIFIGADLATHGALTRALTGGRALATVTQLRTADDDTA